MKFSQNVERCGKSPIRKFLPLEVSAAAAGRRVLHLNIGQPDVHTPEEFFTAVRGFGGPVLEYAPAPGVPAYLDAVRDYYARIGVALEPGDILATMGGSEALEMAMQCILEPGDEVLTPEPFYSNYSTFVNITGAQVCPIPTSVEEGYAYADREKIESRITGRTRAILITNPGNPTGRVLQRDELRMIADIAVRHGLFLVVDEVYREFVYGGERLSSALEFTDAAENVVVIDSISKRFSACGARVGALISRNAELIGQAEKLCQGRLCVATLDQIGAAALYTVDPAYFAAVRDEYRRRRDLAVEKLRTIPGAVFGNPQGAFYIMVRLPVDSTDRFQQWLLEEFEDGGETVMFAPGEGFYCTPGKGVSEARLAYVTNRQELGRALDLLALGIRRYNSR